MSIDAVLDAKIVVCAGSGGVGKTTISAAIALAAAARGRETIVLTIDPAKRLANSLGLEQLPNEPVEISKELFEQAGIAAAPLHAMMLDTKSTFDELVFSYAKNRQRAEKIINNRFYQAISGALSGTHEFMAMEKLYELNNRHRYDLIVIDTPPTRNALDFLDAPKRMTSFLEGRLLKWFLLPAIGGGKGIFKIANFAAVQFLKVVQKIVGAQVLADTAEFFANFEGMYEGFKQRAQSVYDLLREPTTSFVVVTAPNEQAVDEALFFARTLNSYKLEFGGLVVNRLHPHFETKGIKGGTPLLDALIKIASDFAKVRIREERSLNLLEREIPLGRWAKVPFLTEDVSDLASLNQVANHLFDGSLL
ncbi:MAG: ArsA family ATPase [Actinomycetota bacterium]